MVTRTGGNRRNTRFKLQKSSDKKGKVSIRDYYQPFEVDEKVASLVQELLSGILLASDLATGIRLREKHPTGRKAVDIRCTDIFSSHRAAQGIGKLLVRHNKQNIRPPRLGCQ